MKETKTKLRSFLERRGGFIVKLTVFCLLIFVLQRILMPKYMGPVIEGNFTEEYYREETGHELIIIGNCESYENISPMTLWEEYGITSYIRGNSNQLIPQSYCILKETLKYETPKAVLLNIQAMTVPEQTSEEYNRMVFDNMKWSQEKVEGIMATKLSDEHFIEYVFPILRYKNRITDLSKEDFTYAFSQKPLKSYNGYYLRADIRPFDESSLPFERRLPDYSFSEKNMEYLKKITELCKENGIELVLMKAPSRYPVWHEQYEEQIVNFAEENGLYYINTLKYSDEAGIDMDEDTYDEGLHLNVYGAEKIARFIGPILVEKYGLTDFRNDPAISAIYNERLSAYNKEKAEQKAEFEEKGYISKFRNE